MPFEVLDGFPKGLSGDVLGLEWCPTMDLIALITSDSQILVHRVTSCSFGESAARSGANARPRALAALAVHSHLGALCVPPLAVRSHGGHATRGSRGGAVQDDGD